MILEETQDNKDTLIILMIQERDKQIKLLESENANLKKLLIQQIEENRHLIKVIKKLKRYGGTNE
nr:MAG TPA: Speriolin N terminus [Caudoviricetes sp.]